VYESDVARLWEVARFNKLQVFYFLLTTATHFTITYLNIKIL